MQQTPGVVSLTADDEERQSFFVIHTPPPTGQFQALQNAAAYP